MKFRTKDKMCQGMKFFALTVLVLFQILIWFLRGYYVEERECMLVSGAECQLYYLLNLDGMKGLGHSALLLVDETGKGEVLSYNGMQNTLAECLLGKEGIGKMKCFSLEQEELEAFLATGNLQVEDTAECDNFDRVLYRNITVEQYLEIMESANVYIETGDKFEYLYACMHDADVAVAEEAKLQMAEYLAREDLPRYQIYTHNCDTVDRELMALVDSSVKRYNTYFEYLTPVGNYKSMCYHLGDEWGYKRLGEDSLKEKILLFIGLSI